MELVLIPLLFSILFWSGVDMTTDNIGDSLTDIYMQQDEATRNKMELIIGNPSTAAFMGTTYLTADIYNDIVSSNGNVSASDLSDVVNVPDWISSNEDSVVTEIIRDLDHIKFITSSGKYLVITASEPYWFSESVSGKAIDLNFEFYHPDGSKVSYYDAHNNMGWLNGEWLGTKWISSDSLSKVLSTLDISKDGVLTFQYDDNIRGRTYQSTIFWPEYYGTSELDITESAVDIGTAVVDGAEKALNPDGSITLSDGTILYMNPDGTYTLPDSSVVTPIINLNAYDDTALMGLLQQLISKINDLEYQLTFEKDIPTDITTDIAYDGTLSEFVYNTPLWTQVFPFCLPWDFVRGVQLLSSTPSAPVFKIPFVIPSFGLFGGFSSSVTLDFSEYDKYFHVVRWFTTVIFVCGLIFVTFKIVKGVR